jgi:hypothetical protein
VLEFDGDSVGVALKQRCARGFLARGNAGPIAAVRDGHVDGAAAFSETDISDTEFFGQGAHGLGPNHVVQFLAGEGDVVRGHDGSKFSG